MSQENWLTSNGDANVSDIEEQDDIDRAIAASLDLPQAAASHVHDHAFWTPRKKADWATWDRQNRLMDTARQVSQDPEVLKVALESYKEAKAMSESRAQQQEEEARQIRADLAACNYYIGDGSAKEGREEITESLSFSKKPSSPPQIPNGEAQEQRPQNPSYTLIDGRIREMTRNDVEKTIEDEPDIPRSSSQLTPQSWRVGPNIDDTIKQMTATIASEIPWFDVPNGDTWIFIDPPPLMPPYQNEEIYAAYVERCKRPKVGSSSTLKALNSSFFDQRLNPTSQHRVKRRRGLVNRIPDYIKYVIDLTPDSEGDVAAFLMTELCCPEAVRTWYDTQSRWSVSPTLIGGIDEFTIPVSVDQSSGNAMSRRQIMRSITSEYSAIRHRSAIERVLNVIHNGDPMLDSASKMWSTFVIAKHFDITESPLTNYLVTWLRAYPNSVFIEIVPELTLKIADGTRCEELLRDSFAILVGEEALASLRPSMAHTTVYGRRKYDVPEQYQTRIEYASKSFLDRILTTYEKLVHKSMEWIENLPEFQKLVRYAQFSSSSSWNAFSSNMCASNIATVKLMHKLKAYVRGAIWSVAHLGLKVKPDYDLGSLQTDELYPTVGPEEFWETLNANERVLTYLFWYALKRSPLVSGKSNLDPWNQWPSKIQPSWDKQRMTMREEQGIEEIDPDEVLGLMDGYLREAGFYGYHHQLPPLDQETRETGLSQALAYNGAPIASSFYYTPERFDLKSFEIEFLDYIAYVCDSMSGSRGSDGCSSMDLQITFSLFCLGESEWKYLPLYAGGFDDGSGGVFEDEVPPAETGFSTAGPKIHTGIGSSASSSEYEFVSSRNGCSSYNTSTAVNDGFSDTLDKRRVYAVDDGLWDEIRASRDKYDSVMEASESESVASSFWVTAVTTADAAGKDASTEELERLGVDEDKDKGENVEREEENYDNLFYDLDDDDDDGEGSAGSSDAMTERGNVSDYEDNEVAGGISIEKSKQEQDDGDSDMVMT